MHDEHRTPRGWKRTLVLAGIALAGLVAIVGSGGGGVGFIGDPCSGPYAACGPVATALIAPARVTVQVGTMQRFTAQTSGIAAPAYQWQRSDDGGQNPSLKFLGPRPRRTPCRRRILPTTPRCSA